MKFKLCMSNIKRKIPKGRTVQVGIISSRRGIEIHKLFLILFINNVESWFSNLGFTEQSHSLSICNNRPPVFVNVENNRKEVIKY